jgi:hypothetical protein
MFQIMPFPKGSGIIILSELETKPKTTSDQGNDSLDIPHRVLLNIFLHKDRYRDRKFDPHFGSVSHFIPQGDKFRKSRQAAQLSFNFYREPGNQIISLLRLYFQKDYSRLYEK